MTTKAPGVQLDPNDPDDRKIIARQVKAARQAGREGRDRAKSTRGRPDLEAAYDEGANEAAGDDPAEDEAPAPGRGARAGAAARKGGQAAAGYLSRGSWRPTLTPPRRAHDAGGLLVGMLIYTVTITYLRYGPAGWKGWLSAKFLNKPLQGTPASGLGATAGGHPSGNGAT